MKHVTIATFGCALALAACGGSTKTVTAPSATPTQGATSTVEHQLSVCVVEAAYMGSGTQPDCDPTTLSASPYVPASVTCVYKTGNEYTCQATAPDADSKLAGKINGTYDVTYDGTHLAWQSG